MAFKCCICGETYMDLYANKVSFRGKSIDVCDDCNQALKWLDSNNKKEKGMQYLRKKLENGTPSTQGFLLVKDHLHENPTQEEVEAYKTVEEATAVNEESSASTNNGGGGSLVAGIFFLVVAVILYFVSIDNNYGVANIQSTVYSAASFVAAIVCFATSRIIKEIKSK